MTEGGPGKGKLMATSLYDLSVPTGGAAAISPWRGASAFRAGEAWWEPAGTIHRVSRNASAAAPATLLAIYIARPGATPEDLMKPI
jgi:hypothetical protein